MSPFLLVVTVCLFFLLSGLIVLGLRDIYGMEARIGLFVRGMLSGKGIFCPLLYERPYPDYPPLYFLISLIFCKSAGHVCPTCISMPSLLSGALILIILFLTSKRHAGESAALISSLVLAASPKFWSMAEGATVDMLLALCCLLANVFFFCGYCIQDKGLGYKKVSGFLFMSLSYLVKGPIGLVISVMPTVVFLFIKRRTGFLLSFLFSALLVSALVVGVYMVGIYSQGGPTLVEQILNAQLFSRISGEANKPFYYYPAFLVVSFLPTLFLIGLFFKNRKRRLIEIWNIFKQDITTDFGLFVTVFSIFSLLPFFLASSRHGRYLLPAFPPVALLLACFLSQLIKDKTSGTIYFLKKLALTLVLVLYLTVLILYFLDPFHSGLPLWSVIVFFFIGIFTFGIFSLFIDSKLVSVTSFLVSVVIVIAGMSLVIQPGISKRESGRQFVLDTEAKVKAKSVFLVKIRPDGDGLKYSLYSRYYPNGIRFLSSIKKACDVPEASLLILYVKDFVKYKRDDACLKRFAVISKGYIHNKKVIALFAVP